MENGLKGMLPDVVRNLVLRASDAGAANGARQVSALAALFALGKAQPLVEPLPAEVGEQLHTVLDSSSAAIHEAAALATGALLRKQPEHPLIARAVDVLVKRITECPTERRLALLTALSSMIPGEPEAVSGKALGSALSRAAVTVLSLLGENRELRAPAGRFLSAVTPAVMVAEGDIAAFIDALQTEDEEVRGAVLRILGRAGKALVPWLESLRPHLRNQRSLLSVLAVMTLLGTDARPLAGEVLEMLPNGKPGFMLQALAAVQPLELPLMLRKLAGMRAAGHHCGSENWAEMLAPHGAAAAEAAPGLYDSFRFFCWEFGDVPLNLRVAKFCRGVVAIDPKGPADAYRAVLDIVQEWTTQFDRRLKLSLEVLTDVLTAVANSFTNTLELPKILEGLAAMSGSEQVHPLLRSAAFICFVRLSLPANKATAIRGGLTSSVKEVRESARRLALELDGAALLGIAPIFFVDAALQSVEAQPLADALLTAAAAGAPADRECLRQVFVDAMGLPHATHLLEVLASALLKLNEPG